MPLYLFLQSNYLKVAFVKVPAEIIFSSKLCFIKASISLSVVRVLALVVIR